MIDSNYKVRSYQAKPLKKLLKSETLPKGTRMLIGDKMLWVKSDAGPTEQPELRFELNEQALQDPSEIKAVYMVLKAGDRRLWGVANEQILKPEQIEKLKYTDAELADLSKLAAPFKAPDQTLRDKLSSVKRAAGKKGGGKTAEPSAPPARAAKPSTKPQQTALPLSDIEQKPVVARRAPKAGAPKAGKAAAPKTKWVLDLARELPVEEKAAAFDKFLDFMADYSGEFVQTWCDPRRPLPSVEVVATSNQHALVPTIENGEIVVRGIRVQAGVLKVKLADREVVYDIGSFVGHPRQ